VCPYERDFFFADSLLHVTLRPNVSDNEQSAHTLNNNVRHHEVHCLKGTLICASLFSPSSAYLHKMIVLTPLPPLPEGVASVRSNAAALPTAIFCECYTLNMHCICTALDVFVVSSDVSNFFVIVLLEVSGSIGSISSPQQVGV
jgi:hypothetical protein